MKIKSNKILLTSKEWAMEVVSNNKILQLILGYILLLFGCLCFFNRKAQKISVFCIFFVGRVININIFEKFSIFFIKRYFLKKTLNYSSKLEEICIKTDYFKKSLSIYSINDESKVSIFRDIIILKNKSNGEKGVLLIKYTPAFDAFYNYFDYEKVSQDYFIVLEPSWAGACDPSFLMFWRKGTKNVIVQTLESKDYKFIEKMDGNFVPIEIGSSDWTDSDFFTFNPNSEKIYDLIMVSNWGIHKKHEKLFKALSKIEKELNIVLIGFPWGGRTKKDILSQIKKHNLRHHFILEENITSVKVLSFLSASKVFVLLTRKEGGNKAIMESLFSNVPVILYKNFIGGVQKVINENTGIFSSYDDLSQNITFMVENYRKYSPREWVLKNSGSKISTLKLNNLLKSISLQNGENWSNNIVEKVNGPNLKYKSDMELQNDWKKFFFQYKKH